MRLLLEPGLFWTLDYLKSFTYKHMKTHPTPAARRLQLQRGTLGTGQEPNQPALLSVSLSQLLRYVQPGWTCVFAVCVRACVRASVRQTQGNNPISLTNQVNLSPSQKSLYALKTKLTSGLRLHFFSVLCLPQTIKTDLLHFYGPIFLSLNLSGVFFVH